MSEGKKTNTGKFFHLCVENTPLLVFLSHSLFGKVSTGSINTKNCNDLAYLAKNATLKVGKVGRESIIGT